MKINEIDRKYKTLARLKDIPLPEQIRNLYQEIIEYNKNKSLSGTSLVTTPNLTPILIKKFNEVADEFIDWLPDDPNLNKDKLAVKKLKYKLSRLY